MLISSLTYFYFLCFWNHRIHNGGYTFSLQFFGGGLRPCGIILPLLFGGWHADSANLALLAKDGAYAKELINLCLLSCQ